MSDGQNKTFYDVVLRNQSASVIHASSSKSTPVDADEIGLIDSAASFGLKKLTWANVKATLKTYFDTLYQPVGGTTTAGTYTPTLTNVANISSTTAYLCQYLRVGATATVSGKITLTTSAAGVTQLGISLPVASLFLQSECVAGLTSYKNASFQSGAVIYGDVLNGRANLWTNASAAGTFDYYFTITYQII